MWLVAVALASLAGVAAMGIVHDGGADRMGASRPDLQAVLDELVTGPHRIAPGATAYVSGPRGTWLGSAGVADLRTDDPMPTDGRMRLESVSKIYTATLILLLAQDGRLGVDDTVEQWLPSMLPYGTRITIRQLLTMRSGLIDTNDFSNHLAFYLADVRDARLRSQLNALARRIAAHPATIVAPLGFERTAYDPQGPIAGPHVQGYMLTVGKAPLETTDRHVAIGAGGGIVSDARETAEFLQALMQARLLKPQNVAAMRGANLWLGGEQTGCAGAAYGWSGAASGFKTNVWVDRTGTRVAVLLLNARVGGSGGPAGDRAASDALARLYCAG